MAIEIQIQEQLDRLARRQRRLGLWRALSICWGVAAAIGLAIVAIEHQAGWRSALALPVVGLAGIAAGVAIWVRQRKRPIAWRDLARSIEAQHSQLEGRLITSIQQEPATGGQWNYLQQRLAQETLEISRRADWAETIPGSEIRLAQIVHGFALAVFAGILIALGTTGGHHLLARSVAEGITVSPGDTSLERGSSLVVLARFKGALPADVVLVFGSAAATQRFPLVKSLGDPMFGGSIPEVASNFVYHVEYGGQRTRDFNVSVFEHPRLESADASLNFPAYTQLAPKRIQNTRRLSAVEGSQLDLALHFNKPVSSARLVARDKQHTTIPLSIKTNEPAADLTLFPLTASQSYDLQLVDAEGRTNKIPAEFVFDVLKNRPPELRLTSPRGDLRPSPLEEVRFEGTVWDDFGVPAFGLAYAVNGQPPKFIELGKGVPGNQKKTFQHVLRLEDLGLKPDELVSWFVWADDLGPDGQVRRTMGDLYFGEVRPFEEVFREGQGMEGQGGGGEGGGEDTTGKLADLQKQIVNATWRLERDHSRDGARQPNGSEGKAPAGHTPQRPGDQSSLQPRQIFRQFAGQVDPSDRSDQSDQLSSKSRNPTYQEDASVVLDSQAQALELAKAALQRQRDPQAAGLWQSAITEMEAALARLQKATNSPTTLKEALASEEAAYQALLRLEAHEYQVTRSRNQSQSGSGRNQQMQRQLEELDLTQQDNRYENQREVQRAQNPQRREQLQIMSRLQELARRQQDLNDRLKELQNALQEARTEQERAEIRRQLKRLEDEEKQMLADVDELRQRMDRPENQSQLADERRQLDQTRQDVQRAAQSASQGSASQALAAGTRAQNQLEQLRDEVRKKNSSQFADDMRQMRSQARELARRQDEILQKIQKDSTSDKKSLSGSPDQEKTRSELARQKELMTNLVERATQVSQQAEQAEPLMSQQLYDAVRKFTQNTAKDQKEAANELMNKGPMTRSLFELLRDNSEQGGPKMEEVTSELLRLGYLPQAARLGERARTGIEDLKKGVERAAESVLGDDTEDLRLAQRQLDDLARQLHNEIAENNGAGSTNGPAANGGAGSNSQPPGTGQEKPSELAQAQESAQAGQPGQQAGQPGQQAGQPGQQAGQPGQQAGQPGQQAGQPGQQAEGQNSQGNEPNAGNQSGSLAGQPGSGQGRGQAARPADQAGNGGGGGDPVGDPGEAGAGGGGRNFNWDRLRSESVRRANDPITGEGFTSWSDRLREVEELLDQPDLRDNVAKARERARLARQDFKRDRKKPDWAVLQLQVMKPLTEVRDRIADELARRESKEALVPLDRDPVPSNYSELVKRYYEELGKQK